MMQVDFYQLTCDPAEKLLPFIAQRVLGEREGIERRYWKQDGGKWVQGP